MKIDQRAIKKAEKALKKIPNGTPRAIANATNRALTKGRMVVNKGVTSNYTIKATPVKESLAIQKSSVSRLGGKVESTSITKSLTRFKVSPMNAKRKPKVLKAGVKKGSMKPIPGAFALTTKKGFPGVFVRTGKARYPLKYLKGPSIPYMAKNQRISSETQKEMLNMFHTRLEHEVDRLLRKY